MEKKVVEVLGTVGEEARSIIIESRVHKKGEAYLLIILPTDKLVTQEQFLSRVWLDHWSRKYTIICHMSTKWMYLVHLLNMTIYSKACQHKLCLQAFLCFYRSIEKNKEKLNEVYLLIKFLMFSLYLKGTDEKHTT